MHQNEIFCFAVETKAIRTYNYSACVLFPFRTLDNEDANKIVNPCFPAENFDAIPDKEARELVGRSFCEQGLPLQFCPDL